MEERYIYFSLWSLVWIFLLNIKGSTQIESAYLLNFTHGIISNVTALACLYQLIPESMTTTATLSYFIVDFINILINDFYYRAKSYQSPQNRRVEYCHHIFCCTLGLMSEYLYRDFCTFHTNPFVELMFAEFSTPFLIAWRYGDKKSDILNTIFILSFFGCRIIYHGMIFIPTCIKKCHWSVGYGFGIPYDLMNIFFFVMIIRNVIITKKWFMSPKMTNNNFVTSGNRRNTSDSYNKSK